MLKIAAGYIGNDRANVKRNVDYRSKMSETNFLLQTPTGNI